MFKRQSKRFLSIVLSAAMLLTMAPAAAFAEGETSLPEADENGVITLTGDVTLSDAYTVNEGETVTIDLAGHKITNAANKHTIINKGTLTIKDSGEDGQLINNAADHSALQNEPGATATIENGKVYKSNNTNRNDYYVITNHGTLTINGGTITSDSSHSSAIENGWYIPSQNTSKTYANLTINAGEVSNLNASGGLYTLKNDDYGIMTINGGTFSNTTEGAGTVLNWNKLTVNDGTFNAANAAIATMAESSATDASVPKHEYEQGSTTITGGTFKGGLGTNETYSKAISVVVSGGTFSSDVSNVIAENYECVKQDDGTYKVQPLEDKLVVKPSTDESGKVSASLEGDYKGADTTIEGGAEGDETDVTNEGVTVDLTTKEDPSDTTSAALTVTAETAKSLAENKAPGLSVVTDLGTVALDETALGKMENVAAPVVITVTKDDTVSDDNIAAAYTVSVTADGKALLPDGAANGTVTITVPLPADTTADSLQPWYVTESGIYAEKLTVVPSDEGNIAFTIGHLSKIQLLKADPESGTAIASITKADGTKTYYSDVSALQTAVSSATAGDVIDLLDDVTATSAVNSGTITAVFHVNAGVTINGNGHTLAYKGENQINHIININGDADNTAINDLVIDAKNAKYGVQFYCAEGGTLNGVTINGSDYAAVNVNGAKNVKITDSTLNPGEKAYANIDYSMGSGVTSIPSVSVDNVTMKDGIAQIWVDEGTVANMKTQMGSETTNDQILNKVKENVTYNDKDGGSIQIAVRFEAEGDITTGEVESTTQPSQGGGIIAVPSYSVSIDTADNGSVSADRTSAMKGKTVTLTVTPDEGYVLDSLTVTDKNGDAVELTKVSDSEYAFTMPASKVSVAATFVKSGDEPAPSLPFVDVDPDAWYYDAVEYAYNAGLMTGTAADKFSPSLTTTRGMIVSILYRQEGEPAVSTDAGFADVVSGAYYEDAVNWAAEEGIVNGYSDTAFGPNDAITREQMAAILMNYAEYKGQDVTARADLSGYTDADTVSAWATDAVQWANAEGLINGMSDTQLAPKGSATRAQVAAILERFLAE